MAAIIYAIVISAKLKRRFNDLNIGSVYAVISTDKKTKNPYLRYSIDWCFQLIDKKKSKGRYYLKYRIYVINTNTCVKNEYSMVFNMTNKFVLLPQLNNMSIWQRYDNLTDNVSQWLQDLDNVGTYTEAKDLIKGYKEEIANYKKVLV
jgi:hypothetical protein